jgi:hypothetical protein
MLIYKLLHKIFDSHSIQILTRLQKKRLNPESASLDKSAAPKGLQCENRK